MSDIKTFLLPDVGEGLTEAEILTWHVKPGDTVVVNQTIVEIETAKAAVELPCPYAGTVTEVFVSAGDTVEVGTPIIAIATGAAGSAPEPALSPASDIVPAVAVEPDEGKREAVLVGYGSRRARRSDVSACRT